MFLNLEPTPGLSVQLATLSEDSTELITLGCITLKRLNAVSQTLFQIGMKAAITRMLWHRSTREGLANARSKVTIWPGFTEEAVTSCFVLSISNAAG